MKPAITPDRPFDSQKLLIIDHVGLKSEKFVDLGNYLNPGDLVIVNDAATFPASVTAQLKDAVASLNGEQTIEIRLLPQTHANLNLWQAVVFGNGDWRVKTEERSPPPKIKVGMELVFTRDTELPILATIRSVAQLSSRLIEIEIKNADSNTFWAWLYQYGKPVQYSYLNESLSLWSVQTKYSARPWAAEMPSAGRPLTWQMIQNLKQKGVQFARLTHSTGLSSTGDARLDRSFPLPELSDIPEQTIEVVLRTKRSGGRVIAVGTSVVRAIEGRIADGPMRAGINLTDLVITQDHRLKVIDGILTGVHELGESHFRLLEAFSPRSRLIEGLKLAENESYLTHEFGDSCLIIKSGQT